MRNAHTLRCQTLPNLGRVGTVYFFKTAGRAFRSTPLLHRGSMETLHFHDDLDGARSRQPGRIETSDFRRFVTRILKDLNHIDSRIDQKRARSIFSHRPPSSRREGFWSTPTLQRGGIYRPLLTSSPRSPPNKKPCPCTLVNFNRSGDINLLFFTSFLG